MIKRFIPILYLAIITVVMHFVVSSFYKVAESYVPSVSHSQEKDEQVMVKKKAKFLPFSSYNIIKNRNLFKTKKLAIKKQEEIKKVEVVEEPIKPTALKLKLLGTVAEDEKIKDPSYAYAVIEDLKKRKQDLYHVGDPVQQAMILEIRRGSVILKVGNRREILTMEDEKGMGGKKSASKPGPAKSSDGKINLSRRELEGSMKNINKLMSQIRIRPHFNRGRPDGLSVNNIKRQSIFSKMGIKNGDIIQGVNNKKIRTVDDVMSLYQHLQSVSNVSLQIKRRGKTQTIDYNIQ